MKLAEQFLDNSPCTSEVREIQNESMTSSQGMRVRLKDGHSVSIHINLEIFKGNYCHNNQEVDDIEKQNMIRGILKEEIEKFNNAVSVKLKTINGLE